VYDSGGLAFIRHKDWLGSSRLATTWAHAVYSKEAYAPFGEPYNEAGTPDRSFTGQDQNTTQGIYDYLFRKYDPTAGRWLSPDPAGWSAVDPASPQSLNRYAYVQNDPMRLTDTNGLLCTYYNGDGTISYVLPNDCTNAGGVDDAGVYTPNNIYTLQVTVRTDGWTEWAPASGDLYMSTGYQPSNSIDSSGGGGGAPSNATPWYKNPCIQSALAKGVASTALDGVGLLPEGGAVSAAFSLWHGAAGVSNGTKILERAQFGAALISTANAGSGVSGSEGTFSLSGAQALTGAAAIGADLLKTAPIVGQVISGISVAGDLYGTYKAVTGCHP